MNATDLRTNLPVDTTERIDYETLSTLYTVENQIRIFAMRTLTQAKYNLHGLTQDEINAIFFQITEEPIQSIEAAKVRLTLRLREKKNGTDKTENNTMKQSIRKLKQRLWK